MIKGLVTPKSNTPFLASAIKPTGGELRSPPLANDRTHFTLDVDPHSHKHTETRRRHTESTQDDHTELTRRYSGRPAFTFPCLSDSITRLMCSPRVLSDAHKSPLSHTCDNKSPNGFRLGHGIRSPVSRPLALARVCFYGHSLPRRLGLGACMLFL